MLRLGNFLNIAKSIKPRLIIGASVHSSAVSKHLDKHLDIRQIALPPTEQINSIHPLKKWTLDKPDIKTTPLLSTIKEHAEISTLHPILHVLCNKFILKQMLYSLDASLQENYLYEHFIHWLSEYAMQSMMPLQDYLAGKHSLAYICNDFIYFCFKNSILLDPDKTLQSFNNHNQLLDSAVKKELLKISPKNRINILGFGLDDGHYEKHLAEFLVAQHITETVVIYGFDPYAQKASDINYLTPEQLGSDSIPQFDVIISRWALHHVALRYRWADFIKCINHCNPDTLVLAIEHGFLDESYSALDKKLYYLFNATFDIVANIGLRPHYFTSTAPNIGADFFIQYLSKKDFATFGNSIPQQTDQHIYDIGPVFPNQTIYSMRVVK